MLLPLGIGTVILGLLAGLVVTLGPLIKDQLIQVMVALEPWANKLSVQYGYGKFDLSQIIRTKIASFAVLEQSLMQTGTLLSTLVNLILIPLIALWLIVNWKSFHEGALKFVPIRWQLFVKETAQLTEKRLSGWFVGVLTVAVVMGTYYGVALAVVGVPLGLALGFLTGALLAIPIVGYLIGFCCSMLFSLNGEHRMWIATLIIFGIGNVIENFLVTPKVMGQRIGVPSILIILALAFFGAWFDFIGIFLAIPLLIIFTTVGARAYGLYQQSHFYRGTWKP